MWYCSTISYVRNLTSMNTGGFFYLVSWILGNFDSFQWRFNQKPQLISDSGTLVYKKYVPPLRLASTNTRMALTQSSKFSGVTWAASRTMNESESTHLMRDLVSCRPMSCPRVKLYWLMRGWVRGFEPGVTAALDPSRSSLPTYPKQKEVICLFKSTCIIMIGHTLPLVRVDLSLTDFLSGVLCEHLPLASPHPHQ